MEPVDIKVVVNGVEYTVTVTYIGEPIEQPDGSGDLPIEYYTNPKCPDSDQEALHEELTKRVTTAIQLAIEEAKLKEALKDKDDT